MCYDPSACPLRFQRRFDNLINRLLELIPSRPSPMNSSPAFRLLLCSTLCLAGIALSLHGADLTDRYSWKPMKIGGGGWMVGMDIHPSKGGPMYARTDVSGAYRWEPSSSSWKQLLTSDSLPPGYVGYGKYRGVDSLVAAPSDPDIAYMAYEGEIFRSSNRGDLWTATGFSGNRVGMEPNGDGRQEGERLGVDPHNSNVVYYGSIGQGLWFTEDAGAIWTKVNAIPVGTPQHGVNTVVFDRNSGTVPTATGALKTRVIYVTVDSGGVFQSMDAGATWTRISDASGPPSSPRIRDAAIGPDSTFYVTCDNVAGASGSVWKYSPDGAWKDITPSGSQPYWAIAVSPSDPALIVVLCNGGQAFVSRDQGSTWTSPAFSRISPVIGWLGTQEHHWFSTGEIGFAPDGRLWFAEGFGIWFTDDITGKNIPWHAASEGIEEACGNDIIAPPGGKPVAAMWDIGVFRFDDPDAYAAQRAVPYFMSATSLDWCPADPSFIAAVFRNQNAFPPHIREFGYSTDGGVSWHMQTVPAALDYGNIAVSAASPEKIVWAPAGARPLHYTTDRGNTWKPSSLDGAEFSASMNIWASQKPLCADRVLPGTFYFYHTGTGGILRSTDGGATFTRSGKTTPHCYNATLKAAPGHAADLWLAEGSGAKGGLWHSSDGGQNWTAIPFFDRAFNLGFGKPQKDDSYPALYVAGIAQGQVGIYRSVDEGRTWDKIGLFPLGVFDWIDAVDGDKQLFGKVYIGFAGTGFAYGEESGSRE